MPTLRRLSRTRLLFRRFRLPEMLVADENVPARAIAALRAQKIDVVSIRECHAGMSDEAVLALAASQERILVSFDRDYGELIFKHGKPPPRSVIYLRLDPVSAEEVADMLLRLLTERAGAIDGRMVIVTRQGIRQRVFPPRIA